MARYTGPKCKLCRREGEQLYLKGVRCYTAKCGIAKRAYPPGQRTFRRRKVSDYGRQLREKQKAKRVYGVLERQFRRYYGLAERQKGNTGENLIRVLERRMDNVMYVAGITPSRLTARMLITHGHVEINGHKCNIASRLVKPNDIIRIRKGDARKKLVEDWRQQAISTGRGVASWVAVNPEELSVQVLSLPTSKEFSFELQPNLIVELCSK
ncbi:MAG: 30S ribosomal protein S4 [Planctomycetota bacterium]|jgi:small subunit ribosomal protein S4